MNGDTGLYEMLRLAEGEPFYRDREATRQLIQRERLSLERIQQNIERAEQSAFIPALLRRQAN